jgi:hypothetical protein
VIFNFIKKWKLNFNPQTHLRARARQIDTKIRRMLRLKFGWRSLTEYEHGFWLDKNTFIMADKAEIKKAQRKRLTNAYNEIEEADMLILTNVVEMTVDNNGKILGEDKRPNLGLWLDHANRLIAQYEAKRNIKF